MELYYLGLKKKIVQNNNYFKKLIILEGGNDDDICYENIYKKKLDYNDLKNFKTISEFYDEIINKIEKKDKDCRFMLYNQASVEFMKNTDRILCVNDIDLVKTLNNKPKCRDFLENEITCLQYKYLKSKDISYEKMRMMFGDSYNKFVVQQPSGFAGYGTYLLDNSNSILKKLNNEVIYSVSGYVENAISLNNTFMISDDFIHIFEGSYQNIKVNKELNYDGWDFDSYKMLSKNLQDLIRNNTMKIAKKLQQSGYRGICGVDYILKGNNLYFMEINPRFQASSEYLDKSLIKKGLPSLFELNYMAFYNKVDFAKNVIKTKEK